MEAQTINLDPIVGPVMTSKQLFDISKQAVEDSMEYQEFVLNVNKAMSLAAQNGKFFLEVNIPKGWFTVVSVNYRKNGIGVFAQTEDEEHYKTHIVWANG